uniref:Secreted protein n=1 Tax=Arundo donax TaxID=35708 RepID=A0A0A9CVJ5_ARUDO
MTLLLVSLLSRDCGVLHGSHQASAHQSYQLPKLVHQSAQSSSSNTSGSSSAHRCPICSTSTFDT